jgi:uncharacterized cofD-like protein
MKKNTNPNIVVIGGGTGSFVALSGLKAHPVNLSAIVTMSDSGGSNKRIRDEFGLLPTSDIRQCLVALSDEKGNRSLLRQLFMYRFSKGEGITGMTFGNLFMAALSDILGSQEEAIRQTGKVLRIKGRVIPVSFTETNLFAEYENGKILNEEHLIDEPAPGTVDSSIKKVYLKPKAKANQEALDAIKNADFVVVGPGDIYTSIIPNLLVEGIGDSLRKTNAKIVYVLNLMTKYGQTNDYAATDHVKALEKYIGGQVFDTILVNTQNPSKKAMEWYEDFEEYPVVDDLPKTKSSKIIRAHLLKDVIIEKNSSDPLKRSIIRHDPEKLAATIIKLL